MTKATKNESLAVQSVEIQQKTPDDMIMSAIDKGLDVETISKLMDLQERWKRNVSREQFFHGFAKFQALIPELKKTKKVFFQTDRGTTQYFYTPLSEIAKQIKGPLQVAGLTYQFKIKEDGEQISVTCVVTHTGGHSEETTMSGAPDGSGKKNAIQQRGSTITYLQRYTLIGALGITSADDDVDAKQEKQLPTMNAAQMAKTLDRVINGKITIEGVKKHFTITPEQEKQLNEATKIATK